MEFTDVPCPAAVQKLPELEALDAYFAWRRSGKGAPGEPCSPSRCEKECRPLREQLTRRERHSPVNLPVSDD